MTLIDPPAVPMIEIRRRALAGLRRAGAPQRAYDLADHIDVSYDAVLRALDWLAELGLVVVDREGWRAAGEAVEDG